jgi:hypothetical protein
VTAREGRHVQRAFGPRRREAAGGLVDVSSWTKLALCRHFTDWAYMVPTPHPRDRPGNPVPAHTSRRPKGRPSPTLDLSTLRGAGSTARTWVG